MTLKLRLIALGSILALSLSGCASNLPSGAMEESNAFTLLTNEPSVIHDSGASTHRKKGHPKGRGKKGMHSGMMLMMMTRDLDLTADQKTALQSLMKEGTEDHLEMKTQLKTFKAKVQTAFISDAFDAASLQSEWENIKKPDAVSIQLKMAEKLRAAWALLTPEQRAKIESRLVAMESRMAEYRVKRQAKSGADTGGYEDKMLAHMTEQLKLTETQKNTLKARWQAKKADHGGHYALMKGVKQAVLDKLKAGASSAEIAQSMAPLADAMEGKSGKHLSHLADLHGVLTAEQRKLLMTSMQNRSHSGRGHHKR